jgi:hypothetical protein
MGLNKFRTCTTAVAFCGSFSPPIKLLGEKLLIEFFFSVLSLFSPFPSSSSQQFYAFSPFEHQLLRFTIPSTAISASGTFTRLCFMIQYWIIICGSDYEEQKYMYLLIPYSTSFSGFPHCDQTTNFVAWVRERTTPTGRPPLVGEVSANFYW